MPWTEEVQFTVWDFNNTRHEQDTVGYYEEEEEEAVASAIQQFHLPKTAVYAVVWRATDGPAGLETVAKHLVDIQVGLLRSFSL